MVDGLLLINKPAGITSYDVIRKLKPLFDKKQKIGHGGTLDPFANGLVIIMLGRATKLFDSLQKEKKVYKVVGEFGYETDTYDITGQKILEKEKEILEKDFKKALSLFTGEILQKPPMFSAKKVKGKRAYDLAREGKNFDLSPKKVKVYNLKLTNFEPPKFELQIECSSGTYVRSLIVDIARSLGALATPTKLCRERIGKYTLEDAVEVQDVNLERDLRSF